MGRRLQSILGNTYGQLTVKKHLGKKGKYLWHYWECLCTCGGIKEYPTNSLISGNVLSCGCLAKKTRQENFSRIKKLKIKNWLGIRQGNLLCLSFSGKPFANKLNYWLCICDCGKLLYVNNSALHAGQYSCGCQTRPALKNAIDIKYPANRPIAKSKTREYNSWKSMIYRCYSTISPSYQYYGAKGVVVCARWLESFDNFLEDMGNRPDNTSIDRIDTTGDYTPDNCRWADPKTQTANRILK